MLVNTTPVQNYIVRKGAEMLSNKLQTRVSIGHIRIDLLNHLLIEELYIEDKSKDTLLYAGKAEARITDWFLVKNETPVITYVVLENAYVNLNRKRESDKWNYQFIIDAFDTGPSKQPKKQAEFEIDLKKVQLENVRFMMDDAWVGSDMDFIVGSFELDARKIDFKQRLININKIAFENTHTLFRDYEGGRPHKVKVKGPAASDIFDTTAFNADNWKIDIDELQLKQCNFSTDAGSEKPIIGEFDPSHIHINNIDIDATGISIIGDTLKGKIENLAALERCGLKVKKMRADVEVSPIASICNNLYLETNHSKIQHHYAMYYRHFPDFTDYIDKVVMTAELSNTTVDSRDIAYFAPVLRKYPSVIKISGSMAGSVDSFVAKKLAASDGLNIIKGNLSMKGLPDIYSTNIVFTNGEIYTTKNGILKYAPALKDNSSFSVNSIEHAYYKGDFRGYIENFITDGILVSNLGTIQSNIKLAMPNLNGNRSSYAGKISTNEFDIGALFPASPFGKVSMQTTVAGTSFSADAEIKLDATIDRLDYNRYPYKNITAEGTLAGKEFEGTLLINDPNLALAFYGDADFRAEEIKIKATANLLQSNLTALGFAAYKDSIHLTADFDMDWSGNNIDNFLGYARLYNINLLRGDHRLDVDSIYVNSSVEGQQKHLTIQSNLLTGKISGDYLLSSLPYSVQFYISGYLPNYIKAPLKYAPDQNFSFKVVTGDIDSLLAVLLPTVKGFNNATVSGLLNMTQQQLSLNAEIPRGTISNINFNKVKINGDGDLRVLAVNAEAESIVVGDSVFNASVSVTTTLGNDSLQFSIATNSPDTYGTATVNGQAYASGDTLSLTLLPSEFFLKDVKWKIPAGNEIVFADKFLSVRKLFIRSGEQEIAINSQNESSIQSVVVSLKQLDIAALGNLEALAYYKPSGRINGNIQIDSVFTNTVVSSSIQATNIVMLGDTLGNVNITGTYDIKKNRLTLDGKSGIYYGNSSITMGGHIVFFDKNSKEAINGVVSFNNASLTWISPLLAGYVSNISGDINGKIEIGGNAENPQVKGTVLLDNASLKVDFLGTTYTIHHAAIDVDNKKIDLGEFSIFDVYKNAALVSGTVNHDRFSNFTFNINASSSKFEAINLKANENETFYGNLIAGFQSLSVRGPIEDLNIRITRATPADKSHIYLPIGTTTAGISSYSYVSFKSYDTVQHQVKRRPKQNKLTISIESILNDLAEITMILDPATGDAINASGTGNLNMEIPLSDDVRMYGSFNIERGDYTFTLPKLYFKRKFNLNKGSKIRFNGLIEQTDMDVEGVYYTRARLYDLLNPTEKKSIAELQKQNPTDKEVVVAKSLQDINVLLFMRGSLNNPALTFRIELPGQYGSGTLAYDKLRVINQNYEQQLTQVASLLLISSFVSPDAGAGDGAGARTGAISNFSEMLSGTASSQITNIVSKLTGDKDLAIDLRYKQYSYETEDQGSGAASASRNQFSLGVRKSLFDNRLTVQVGSSYDWGKQVASKSTTNNFAGDFKAEWQIQEGGNLRLNFFRTGSYDVLVDRNISRGGVGISWRKSFNSFEEFFRGTQYWARKREEDSANIEKLKSQNKAAADKPLGTE